MIEVARPHISEIPEYKDIYSRIPERARRHIEPFGTAAENYWGVKINDRYWDLRQTSLFLYGHGDDERGKKITKRIDISAIEALVDLETIDIERCYLDGQASLRQMPNLKNLKFFEVQNFSGDIPESLESMTLRFCNLGHYSLNPKTCGNLRRVNFYGSSVTNIGNLAAKSPHLESVELWGTPIHTKLTGTFNSARIGRILSGEWRIANKAVEEQVRVLRDRGVEVTFEYDPPYLA